MNKNYQLITSFGYELKCEVEELLPLANLQILPKGHSFFGCYECDSQNEHDHLHILQGCNHGKCYHYKSRTNGHNPFQDHQIKYKAAHAKKGSKLDEIMDDALQTIPHLRALKEVQEQAAEIAAACPPITSKAPSKQRGRL